MTEILPNGDLKITASNLARQSLAYECRASYQHAECFVAEMLHEAFEFIRPEAIGALTDAPILTDEADYSDEQMDRMVGPAPYPDAAVWWFPDYMIRDPWKELASKGFVIFTKAP